jgi:hypothetical protein
MMSEHKTDADGNYPEYIPIKPCPRCGSYEMSPDIFGIGSEIHHVIICQSENCPEDDLGFAYYSDPARTINGAIGLHNQAILVSKVAELEEENSELKGTMDDLEEDVTRLGLVNTALTGVIDRIRGGKR